MFRTLSLHLHLTRQFISLTHVPKAAPPTSKAEPPTSKADPPTSKADPPTPKRRLAAVLPLHSQGRVVPAPKRQRPDPESTPSAHVGDVPAASSGPIAGPSAPGNWRYLVEPPPGTWHYPARPADPARGLGFAEGGPLPCPPRHHMGNEQLRHVLDEADPIASSSAEPSQKASLAVRAIWHAAHQTSQQHSAGQNAQPTAKRSATAESWKAKRLARQQEKKDAWQKVVAEAAAKGTPVEQIQAPAICRQDAARRQHDRDASAAKKAAATKGAATVGPSSAPVPPIFILQNQKNN